MRRELVILLGVLAVAACLSPWLRPSPRVDWSRPLEVDGVGLGMTAGEVRARLGEPGRVHRETDDSRQQRWEYPGPEGTTVNLVQAPGTPGVGLQVVGVLGRRLAQGGRPLLETGARREEALAALGPPAETHPGGDPQTTTFSWHPTLLFRPHRAVDREFVHGRAVCTLREGRVSRVGLFIGPPRPRVAPPPPRAGWGRASGR